MPNDTLDVDKLAEGAERMGLVSPDPQGPAEDGDEIVVLIHISGGIVAGVGTMRRDLPRLRVIVADDDVLDDGDSDGSYWTESATALEGWGRGQRRCTGAGGGGTARGGAAGARADDLLPASVEAA